MIGTKLTHYEITAHLGSGGMGDVYQATDFKLGRDVAIKLLPEAFTHDADRTARFEREARVLASLNHPNIAAIYGVEESDGGNFLVMELVGGETLAERIKRGPIPVDESLEIAQQICEALESAHEKAIIHRDLKPANVKITPDGKVKVLDFGLAKVFESETSKANLSQSPTLSMAATNAGVILGTAAYMSPEQAKGRTVDQRTDIFAFGCVLYEMLTGRQAFEGDDVTEILAAIVRAEPDWDRLPEKTPASIRMLLRKCLRKERTLRLQSAGDARIEIQEALSAPALVEETITGKGAPGLGRRAGVLLGAGGMLLGGLIAGVTAWTVRPLPPRSVIRVAVPLPQDERLPTLNTPVLALSPDGSRLAFISARTAGQQIYVRAFDSAEAKLVPGTEGADGLSFSPDGKWLAFTARGNLMRVSMGGGAPLLICSAPNTEGLSWGDNDTIVFAPGYGIAGLSRVPAGGGKPQTLTTLLRGSDSSEEAHRWPQVLPGSKAVLFTAWTRNLDDAQIVVQRLDSNERRVVLHGGSYARYLPTGHLVYVRAGTLIAVPFDISSLEATADPVPLAESVLLTTEGAAQFDVSSDGSFVHVPGGLQGSGSRLTWVDRSGNEELIGAPSRAYLNPRISPDGLQIAVVVQGANDDVWTYDISHQTLTRLTSESRSLSPVWAADGKRIVYRSNRNGFLNLFAKAADGSSGEERLTTSEENQVPQAAAPDGQTLAFIKNLNNNRELWILPLVGDRKPRIFLQAGFTGIGVACCSFSPDSHWLAYNSNESGRNEIYVQPYPGGGRKVQVSRDGGTEPRWIGSGELFYRDGARMMAVKVSTNPTLTVGEPHAMFEGQYLAIGGSTFDVSPDGKRFLMIKEAEQAASVTRIDVVVNWIEELKRAVPVR